MKNKDKPVDMSEEIMKLKPKDCPLLQLINKDCKPFYNIYDLPEMILRPRESKFLHSIKYSKNADTFSVKTPEAFSPNDLVKLYYHTGKKAYYWTYENINKDTQSDGYDIEDEYEWVQNYGEICYQEIVIIKKVIGKQIIVKRGIGSKKIKFLSSKSHLLVLGTVTKA